MKIRIYLAVLIARLEISKFIKKLYRQSKLLPVADKFNESRKILFERLCFLVSVNIPCFLLVSFPFRLTLLMFQTS